MWGLFAAAAFVGFLWYRQQVLNFLRSLWAELLALLSELFGHKRKSSDQPAAETREPPRPFAAFRNPFLSGNAGRIAPEQLVRYTFEGLEAWAFERQAARRADETPMEFADTLDDRFPALAGDARELARLYSHMLYARTKPTRECLPLLQRLWEEMSRATRQYSAARSE